MQFESWSNDAKKAGEEVREMLADSDNKEVKRPQKKENNSMQSTPKKDEDNRSCWKTKYILWYTKISFQKQKI